MPPRSAASDIGERLARIEATVESEKEYQHDRWHKLANDLTPILNLPERLTREVGRLHGIVDGRIGSVSKDIERSMEATIVRVLQPVTDDVSELKREIEGLRGEIEQLKMARSQWTGARMATFVIIQTLISTAAAVGAVLGINGGRTLVH